MAKTLHYDFATDKSLVARAGPILNITRATEASYFDSIGALQIAASGVAAFDHLPIAPFTSLGISIWEARTNLWLQNQDWANAAYSATNITAVKDATGLDKVVNSASTLTADANDGTITQTITIASAAFTTSVWMKRKTGTGTVEITDNDFTNAVDITADINSSTWTKVGDITRTQANPVVGVRLGTSGDAVEVDIGQTEAGTFSTPPIPTIAASVTRNKDDTLTTDINWYKSLEGTFYAAGSLPLADQGATGYLYSCSDNSSSDHTSISRSAVTGRLTLSIKSGGATAASLILSDILADNTLFRSVVAEKVNDFEFYADGIRSGTGDQAGAMPLNILTFNVGSTWAEATQWNGHIAEIAYFDERLSNDQLEQMSINGISGAKPYLALYRRKLDGPPTKAVYPKPKRGLRGYLE